MTPFPPPHPSYTPLHNPIAYQVGKLGPLGKAITLDPCYGLRGGLPLLGGLVDDIEGEGQEGEADDAPPDEGTELITAILGRGERMMVMR